jgi:diacylglycerol O-acyltransferase
MDHLNPLDAVFLDVEDDITHMHIGSCAVFEGPPPPFDDLVSLTAAKLPALERYRQVVRTVPGGFARPVWVDDVHFNVAYHIRHTALPAPGDEAVLNRLMGRLMSQPLDRRRPLWEMWVVEGLTGNRWAIVSKVHHCMVDGISGTDLMATLLDTEPDVPVTPAPRWAPSAPPTDLALVVDAVRDLVTQPAAITALMAHAARAPHHAAAALGDVMDGLRDYGDRLSSRPPLVSIEGAIGPHRRWAVARCELDDVKAIKRQFGGSVNDVVVAVITGAFRRLLIERGDRVDAVPGADRGRPVTLRSLVPVSSRPPDDHSPNNQVTAIFADLPVGITDPVVRLQAVAAELSTLKRSHQPLAGEAITAAAALAPPALVSFTLRVDRAGTSAAKRQHGHDERARSAATVVRARPSHARVLAVRAAGAGRPRRRGDPHLRRSRGVRRHRRLRHDARHGGHGGAHRGRCGRAAGTGDTSGAPSIDAAPRPRHAIPGGRSARLVTSSHTVPSRSCTIQVGWQRSLTDSHPESSANAHWWPGQTILPFSTTPLASSRSLWMQMLSNAQSCPSCASTKTGRPSTSTTTLRRFTRSSCVATGFQTPASPACCVGGVCCSVWSLMPSRPSRATPA